MSVLATKLEDLVGEHLMDHTPSTDVRHPFDSDSNGIAFTIDGNTYMVFEDGNDGYRPSAGPLLGFKGMPYEIGGDYGEYCRLKVVGSMCLSGDNCSAHILEFRLVETGAVVLRVGTDNDDDYYPSFVAEWSPPVRPEPQA